MEFLPSRLLNHPTVGGVPIPGKGGGWGGGGGSGGDVGSKMAHYTGIGVDLYFYALLAQRVDICLT